MKIRDGICLPNGCVNLESVKKFKLSPEDIIVSSYPKSGRVLDYSKKRTFIVLDD